MATPNNHPQIVLDGARAATFRTALGIGTGDGVTFDSTTLKSRTTQPLSADPGDPAEGESVEWVSDGTASGDAGDVMRKTTSGGVTKTETVSDFSALA